MSVETRIRCVNDRLFVVWRVFFRSVISEVCDQDEAKTLAFNLSIFVVKTAIL